MTKQWTRIVYAGIFVLVFMVPLAIFGFGVLMSMAWNLTKLFFE